VRGINLSVIALILTEKEAAWLKALVQNPIIENETEFDRQMRSTIFVALNNICEWDG
jgi:hypothetical protein